MITFFMNGPGLTAGFLHFLVAKVDIQIHYFKTALLYLELWLPPPFFYVLLLDSKIESSLNPNPKNKIAKDNSDAARQDK
jgi:CRISPR/Cas system-associated endonuclease Cas1